MKEWRYTPDGKTKVSNEGDIIKIKNGVEVEPKIYMNVCGYPTVSASYNYKCRTYAVHRLVALVFLPNPDNHPQVNHKNGNKLNNHVDNLEWCTVSQNIQHAYDNGLMGMRVNGKPCARCGRLTMSKKGICPVCSYPDTLNYYKELTIANRKWREENKAKAQETSK